MTEQTPDTPASPAPFVPFNQAPEILSEEMLNYLEFRSKEAGISIEDAYREEIAARQELAKIIPSHSTLAAIADRSVPAHDWRDE